MTKKLPILIACAATLATLGSACSKKQDPVGELEKAAAAMAKPEPAAASADAAPAEAPAARAQVPSGPPPAQQVQLAITDYKAGKMEDAVTRLQLLRNMPVMSPQQRMALQDSIAAVMTEVYALAEKGDARAIAAVARYERMQTGH